MASIRTNLGEVKRGEVYFISYDDSFGTEIQTGRPAVIVSSDNLNEVFSVVTVVFITTSPKYGDNCAEIHSTGRQAWAVCNQIKVVDKTRLRDRKCLLTAAEMEKIDASLRAALDLPVVKENPEQEKEVEALRKAVADATTEIEVLKRAYERVLDKLVEMRIASDMAARVVKPEAPVAAPVVAPVAVVQPVTESVYRVDINRASFAQLKKLGFSDNVAMNIISNKPYKNIDDLRRVPGVTSISYGLVKNKITVGNVIVEKPLPEPKTQPAPDKGKVNVNTATAKELVEGVGLNISTARCVVAYRKKVGRIERLEDLVNANRFGSQCLAKYGPLMEV